jgi:hypothetical protein
MTLPIFFLVKYSEEEYAASIIDTTHQRDISQIISGPFWIPTFVFATNCCL